MQCIADANVLLPLLTNGHAHRPAAASWWNAQQDDAVGLCFPVRMALLRLLTNARVMASGTLQPEQAWEVLSQLTCDPRIVLIGEPPVTHARYWRANIARREPTPDLWTDAWLAALAQATECEMTTLIGVFARLPT